MRVHQPASRLAMQIVWIIEELEKRGFISAYWFTAYYRLYIQAAIAIQRDGVNGFEIN
jgi:hypothetical protein